MRWKPFLCIALLLAAASIPVPPAISAPNSGEILVSAAISLKNAFEEIGLAYEKQTGVRVRFNFGASGLLQKQLEAGAPVDVFASASAKQMDELQARNMILPETRRNFAGNSLVLILPMDSKLRIHSFADLGRSRITRLAIGNPKTVPVGQYAREALRNLKLWDALQPSLVLAENVRQVMDYVVRGEVDAGIVYLSDVSIVPGKIKVAAQAPRNACSAIIYPIAVVRDSANSRASRQFIHLVLSKTGQTILTKYGFPGAK